MIIYLSGGDIEEILKEKGVPKINLMLSFFNSSKKKVEKRFLKLFKQRRKEFKNATANK
jgi:hypothetical protein